jgi:hypothetical protein
MKRNVILNVILALAFLLQPQAQLSQAQQTHNRQRLPAIYDFETSNTAGNHTISLPFIAAPPGPPDFEITTPGDGWTVSGMMHVVAQARDPETITSMTFRAGTTVLGTDDTPADGLRVFFDASAFPAGDVVLTAVADGPSGQTSKSITVNVLPDPPSSGTIGTQGGVLASEIGSIITIPPHALPEGTQLTVDELTQQEVTAQNGIDWDAMGVTFLGAQDIQSTASFSLPYRVASADFGNRVQPGQVVVNYQIVPDADGDGVDEIVVVNTASVAPNNDVISDPIPQVMLEDEVVVANKGSFSVVGSGSIQGPPGTMIEIDATGLNPFSVAGNTAVFHSIVKNTDVQIPVVLSPDLDEESSSQTLSVIVPMLPPGPATLSFHNASTGDTTEPMAISVEAAVPITRPADEIIDDFFSQSLTALLEIEASAGEDEDLDALIAEFTEVKFIFEQLSNDSSPEVQQFLTEAATLIENSGILEANQAGAGSLLRAVAGCFTKMQLKVIRSLTLIGITLTTIGCGILFTPLGGALCGGALALAYGLIEIWFLADSECPPPTPPPPSPPPSPTAALSGPTGMGSAPPPGGSAAGNVVGAGSGNGRSPTGTGNVVIKIFSGGSSTPFSGVVDPGGYFFIPFVPAGSPFTAVAYDLTTDETRVVDGIGPATGDFEFMLFDFFSEPEETDTVTWDGGGDGTSWHDANNWSGDVVPGAADDVLIDVPGNITVTHSFGSHAVRSLHSEEAILISSGFLDIEQNSILSNTLALKGGSLSGNADITLNGLLVWRQGNMGGSGTTTANGDIHFNDNVNRGLVDGRTLINNGTAVWQNGSLNLYFGSTIINLPGAVFEFRGDYVNGISGGAGNLFHNMGTVIKAAGSGPGIIGSPFNNSGIVEIQEGTFIIQESGTYSGIFQGTGTLEIRGKTHVLNGSITNLNVLFLSDPTSVSNTLFINGTYDAISTTVTGDNAIVSAALNIGAGVTAHSDLFNINGGTVTGDGDLVVSGPTTWSHGTMSGAGTTTAMGGLTFTGNNSRVLDGRTLVNNGAGVYEDGWLYINNGGLLHNTSTATWDFLGDDVVSTSAGGGTFQNDGSLTKSAGSGTANMGATFINNGDVSVQSGALRFGGDFTQTASGTLFVQIGGLIPITEFDQYQITGAATLDGTLDVTLTGGFVPNPGDNFTVLTFASHTGQFATVNGHGQGYTVNYNAANITLTAQ